MSLTSAVDEDNVFIPKDIDEFVKALQDLGQRNVKTKEQKIEYKDLDKYCRGIAKLWKENKFDGFPKNQTHAKQQIIAVAVQTG